MWFLARFYSASEADKMGLVNTVVPVSYLVAASNHYKVNASSVIDSLSLLHLEQLEKGNC